jgi:hypothetical protein
MAHSITGGGLRSDTGSTRCGTPFPPFQQRSSDLAFAGSPSFCSISTTSIMHPEVLTDAAAELFPSLSHFPDFYLAGGTALALQIGHRISVDFDLFNDDDISRSLLRKVQQVFPTASIIPLVNNGDELTVLINGVKFTFLRYPYPPLDRLYAYQKVPYLSVREIAATKAYTIGRRGSYKDYVDLYFCVSEGYTTLPTIIDDAEQKFGKDFNSRLFLEQLIYVADLDNAEIQFLKPVVTAREIVSFFESRIRDAGI